MTAYLSSSMWGSLSAMQTQWMEARDKEILRAHDASVIQQTGLGDFTLGQIIKTDANSTLNFVTEQGDVEVEKVGEFKKLSNHKFHELLEEFKKRANK